jgi:hypothetical protein
MVPHAQLIGTPQTCLPMLLLISLARAFRHVRFWQWHDRPRHSDTVFCVIGTGSSEEESIVQKARIEPRLYIRGRDQIEACREAVKERYSEEVQGKVLELIED